MQWLGQRLWDIPVSSEPSKNVGYNSALKGRAPEKNLEFVSQKSLFFHQAVESGRVVVITPPQPHLPTSALCSGVRPCSPHPTLIQLGMPQAVAVQR